MEDHPVPGIANSEALAKGFVERIVMQTVFDVPELQARSALLLDTLISSNSGQLSVWIRLHTNELPCGFSPVQKLTIANEDKEYCILVSSTVTGICKTMKVIRLLASGPFGSHFLSASGTVGEN
ncbi:hypothetical protein KIN20_028213 [Parelaphostrongylus tenuis]|uniref:Uncharacterized protein n=1 Tax=Parelaphostrongylus tenuis TaxID=148309 RepID=A0AAD5R175_PARTN|nr:hypothetical protein KIN20_028213 [Parelaphostrongylus tenuis]